MYKNKNYYLKIELIINIINNIIMKKNLVIVESPAKCITISKYLNNNPQLEKYGSFDVIASFGHIRDLKKKELSIDIEDNFKPIYEFLADKKKYSDNIKNKAKEFDNIYLATDDDFDGVFIGESIRILLKLGNNYKRIVFHEITSKALQYAIEHPTKIDEKQLESQQTRRILDRLAGYKLSQLLWSKFTSGNITLSAGRVQSCLLNLIIKHEKEIENFKTNSYWHIIGNFILNVNNDNLQSKFPTLQVDKINLTDINLYKDSNIYKETNSINIENLLKNIKNKWLINDIKSKESSENPSNPFITSTLQQEASSKLKTNIKNIMQLAQFLYEKGKITYIRSDSYVISQDFKDNAIKYIEKKYGSEYIGEDKQKKSIKGSQNAHECIRVTNIEETELETDNIFKEEHCKLYKLIWQRTICSLMSKAIYNELHIKFRDENMTQNINFVSTFKEVKFNGFLIIYGIKNESNNFDILLKQIKEKKYEISCSELKAKNTYLSQPSRYNDSGLVKLMEHHGIGRPATMVSIIEKLYDKKYIIKTDIKGEEKDTTDYTYNPSTKSLKKIKGTTLFGEEKNKLVSTDIGKEINNYLEKNFDYITNTQFTSSMENDLDEIQNGTKTKLDILNTFWKRFSKDLKEQTSKRAVKKIIKTENKEITINNIKYIIRIAKYGPVIQYDINDKKKYIPLKGYLSIFKKEYLDIDENDIKFLVKLPNKIGDYNDKDIILENGSYGLYLIYDKKNIKIPNFAYKEFIETKKFTNEQLKGFIEYSLNKKK